MFIFIDKMYLKYQVFLYFILFKFLLFLYFFFIKLVNLKNSEYTVLKIFTLKYSDSVIVGNQVSNAVILTLVHIPK